VVKQAQVKQGQQVQLVEQEQQVQY